MVFKYGITKLIDKKNVISFIRNLGYNDDVSVIMSFIRRNNINGYRVLVLIKGE